MLRLLDHDPQLLFKIPINVKTNARPPLPDEESIDFHHFNPQNQSDLLANLIWCARGKSRG